MSKNLFTRNNKLSRHMLGTYVMPPCNVIPVKVRVRIRILVKSSLIMEITLQVRLIEMTLHKTY